jgi:hypothetical protein
VGLSLLAVELGMGVGRIIGRIRVLGASRIKMGQAGGVRVTYRKSCINLSLYRGLFSLIQRSSAYPQIMANLTVVNQSVVSATVG